MLTAADVEAIERATVQAVPPEVAASFGHGWLGVHGMRTSAEGRGQGLEGRILRAMAAEASRRGVTRVFLQVDANNPPALALYRRAGFAMAWPYAYWRPLRLD